MEVLLKRVAEMIADIKKQSGSPPEARRFSRKAKKQTSFFVELYCVAVNALIHKVISLMEMNTLVQAYCDSSSSPCPYLFDQMTEGHNSVQICFETICQIQQRYFGGVSILPAYYGFLIESQLGRCVSIRALVAKDPACGRDDLFERKQCVDQALASMKDFISIIQGPASLMHAHTSGLFLAHAEQEMWRSYLKYKKYSELLANRRGSTFREGGVDYFLGKDVTKLPSRVSADTTFAYLICDYFK